VAEKLRALGQILGPARDWDVFLAGAVAKVAPPSRRSDRSIGYYALGDGGVRGRISG
jgi:hypothetical protein